MKTFRTSKLTLIFRHFFNRNEFLVTSPLMLTSPVYIIRRSLYKSILKIAPKVGGDVLDIGCGEKPYESLFINANSYIGVDIEKSGHDHNNSKADIFYDGKVLPFPDNYFNSILCLEVIEHIFNIDEVLLEVKRVLKPGGLFVGTIPFSWPEHEIPYDFARYTSYGIFHILSKSNLEVIQCDKSTSYFLAVSQLFIYYLYLILPGGPILGSLFRVALFAPLNIIFILLDYFLPKKYNLFSNIIFIARHKLD
jgi:SAM-dependent methyltransferase